MVKRGKIDFNGIEDPILRGGINTHLLMVQRNSMGSDITDIILKIEYLFDHPSLEIRYPNIYNLTLKRLKDRYFEVTGKVYESRSDII